MTGTEGNEMGVNDMSDKNPSEMSFTSPPSFFLSEFSRHAGSSFTPHSFTPPLHPSVPVSPAKPGPPGRSETGPEGRRVIDNNIFLSYGFLLVFYNIFLLFSIIFSLSNSRIHIVPRILLFSHSHSSRSAREAWGGARTERGEWEKMRHDTRNGNE